MHSIVANESDGKKDLMEGHDNEWRELRRGGSPINILRCSIKAYHEDLNNRILLCHPSL